MVAVGDGAANSLLESAQKLQMSAFGRRWQQEAWVAPVWLSQASYRADSQLSLLLTASRRQSGKGTWVDGEDWKSLWGWVVVGV